MFDTCVYVRVRIRFSTSRREPRFYFLRLILFSNITFVSSFVPKELLIVGSAVFHFTFLPDRRNLAEDNREGAAPASVGSSIRSRPYYIHTYVDVTFFFLRYVYVNDQLLFQSNSFFKDYNVVTFDWTIFSFNRSFIYCSLITPIIRGNCCV